MPLMSKPLVSVPVCQGRVIAPLAPPVPTGRVSVMVLVALLVLVLLLPVVVVVVVVFVLTLLGVAISLSLLVLDVTPSEVDVTAGEGGVPYVSAPRNRPSVFWETITVWVDVVVVRGVFWACCCC